MALEGGCACGSVRYRLTEAPMSSVHGRRSCDECNDSSVMQMNILLGNALRPPPDLCKQQLFNYRRQPFARLLPRATIQAAFDFRGIDHCSSL